MNTIHRLLFRQLFVATVMAVGLFVFVIVLVNVLREVLDLLATGRLTWDLFFYILVLLIPGVIPYALPLGMLSAVLLVIGRFSAQNEYTAMRASGMSLWSLAAPVLFLASLGALVCLFINFFYAPAADHAYRVTIANLARNNPVRFFQPRAFVRDFSPYIIYVGERHEDQLEDFHVWVLDLQGRVLESARSRRGTINYDRNDDLLHITLYDASVTRRRSSDPEDLQDPTQPTFTSAKIQYPLTIDQLLHPQGPVTKLSLFTLPELLEARSLPPPDKPTATPEETQRWHTRVEMQIQRHFAGAFSVLALALLAIPLGLHTARAETFANIALGLALAFTYYILLFLVTLLQNHPEWRPDLLIWLPNFICEALGLALLWRAARS